MTRIKGKDLYLKDDDQIYFGDNQEAQLWYLDSELRLDHTISGTAATAGYHLIQKQQVEALINTAVSGIGVAIYPPGDFLTGVPSEPDLATAGPLTAYVFDDSKDENIFSTFVVPEKWKANSNITIKIGYMVDNAQSGTNSAVWRILYHSYVDGGVYASKTTTTLTLTSTLPNNCVAGYFKYDTFPLLTYNHVNNPFSAGTTIPFQLQRQGTAGGDTMTDDAAFLVLIFLYETEAR
jgi:hypothetical protein